MPPKKAQKKPDKKKQAKAIEDKTFGLKNKNKSKVVQKYVSQVVVTARGGAKTDEERQKAKKAAKAAKQAEQDQLNALFSDALITGNKAVSAKKGGKANEAVGTGKQKQVQETYEVIEEEKGIEDIIEEQRAKLAAEGKKGTPVTEESLAIWKADRKAKKLAEEKKLLQKELAKKKGGKGLSVLSGRALYDYDSTLFQDDDGAFADTELAHREEVEQDEDEGGDRKMPPAAAAAAAASLDVGDEDVFGDDDDLDDLDD